MTFEEFLSLWEEKTGASPQPSGSGFVGLCPVPAHDDRDPSLSVMEGDDGVVLKCHGGCDNADVVSSLGLEFRDLFYSSVNYAEPEVVYDYVDELGNVLFQVVRFPGKKFRQRHLENGEWVWNLEGVRRVLYCLPEVVEAVRTGRTVYLVEGEKDADTLRRLGYCATTSPAGAGKWRDDYTEFLAGANVIIVADRDAPGRAHAQKIREALQGVAQGIWIMQAKVGKDVTDHVEHGHQVQELVPVKIPGRRGLITASELAEQALEDLEMKPGDIPGYQPWDVLPQFTFRAGRVYPIGGYTGDGKTSASLQAFRKLASEGTRVGFFSLEMPVRDLQNKLLQHRGIPLQVLEKPWEIPGSQWEQPYRDGVAEISSWQADIIFKSDIKADEIVDTSIDREYDVVFVDHLHRLSWEDRRKFEQDVNRLTNLALEQNICLVLLCQLRKFARGRDLVAYPKPTLQDITETSMIGNEASMALGIWRQRNDAGMQYTGLTEVIILKNRHTTGPHDRAGMVYVPYFDPIRSMFAAEAPGEEWSWEDEAIYTGGMT